MSNRYKKLNNIDTTNCNTEKLLELCDIVTLCNNDENNDLEKGLTTTYNLYDNIYKDLKDLKNDNKESLDDRIWAVIIMEDIFKVKKELMNMNELIFAKEIKSTNEMTLDEILND